jgi:hypothetical protein
MRANIGSPSRSATSKSASIAACHSLASVLGLRQLGGVVGCIAQRDQLAPARRHDRIAKNLWPHATQYSFPLRVIVFNTAENWAVDASEAISVDQNNLTSCH